MKIFRIFSLLLLLLTVLSCNTVSDPETPKETQNTPTVVYLIRHAEKDRSNLDDPNPELTEKGLERAKYWNTILKKVPLSAIYSTNFHRTMQTAMPTARAKHLEIINYDDGKSAVPQWLKAHKGEHILIVGHSNTIPGIVNTMLGEEKYEQIEDTNNANLYMVTLSNNGAQSILLTPEFTCNPDMEQP